jgi:hypothetical protein
MNNPQIKTKTRVLVRIYGNHRTDEPILLGGIDELLIESEAALIQRKSDRPPKP